jgi:hypothetical protein
MCGKIQSAKESTTMGRVIIELPLKGNRHFRITDADVAAKVLQQLEGLAQVSTDLSDVTDDEVLSVWADRTESPDEIARQLRQGNRRHG